MIYDCHISAIFLRQEIFHFIFPRKFLTNPVNLLLFSSLKIQLTVLNIYKESLMAEKVSNQSLLTWFLQRLSGLFLAFFLFTHIDVNHFLHQGMINFGVVSERLSGSFGWKLYYFLFVPFCIFHALNGIWAILADYRPSGGFSVFTKAVFWILGLILTIIGALTLTNLFSGRG